jgi:hypothetical protein
VHDPQTEREFGEAMTGIAAQRLMLPVIEIEGSLTALPMLSYWGIADVAEQYLAKDKTLA